MPLGADLFPNIENPFKTIVIPDLVGQVSETVTATTPVAAAPLTTGLLDKEM